MTPALPLPMWVPSGRLLSGLGGLTPFRIVGLPCPEAEAAIATDFILLFRIVRFRFFRLTLRIIDSSLELVVKRPCDREKLRITGAVTF